MGGHRHTAEDGLTITFEISKTTRRTWRSRSGVRVSVDEVNFTLGWTALQFDNETLTNYFGGGDVSAVDTFGVVTSPAPVERALFIRLVDGAAEVDLYVAKAAIGPEGSPPPHRRTSPVSRWRPKSSTTPPRTSRWRAPPRRPTAPPW